jgi:hypothetical protein
MKRYGRKFDDARSSMIDVISRAIPIAIRYSAIQRTLNSSGAELVKPPSQEHEPLDCPSSVFEDWQGNRAKELESARAELQQLWKDVQILFQQAVEAYNRLQETRSDAALRKGLQIDVPGPVLQTLLLESNNEAEHLAARLVSPEALYVMPIGQFCQACSTIGKSQTELIAHLSKLLDEWETGPNTELH